MPCGPAARQLRTSFLTSYQRGSQFGGSPRSSPVASGPGGPSFSTHSIARTLKPNGADDACRCTRATAHSASSPLKPVYNLDDLGFPVAGDPGGFARAFVAVTHQQAAFTSHAPPRLDFQDIDDLGFRGKAMQAISRLPFLPSGIGGRWEPPSGNRGHGREILSCRQPTPTGA